MGTQIIGDVFSTLSNSLRNPLCTTSNSDAQKHTKKLRNFKTTILKDQ